MKTITLTDYFFPVATITSAFLSGLLLIGIGLEPKAPKISCLLIGGALTATSVLAGRSLLSELSESKQKDSSGDCTEQLIRPAESQRDILERIYSMPSEMSTNDN